MEANPKVQGLRLGPGPSSQHPGLEASSLFLLQPQSIMGWGQRRGRGGQMLSYNGWRFPRDERVLTVGENNLVLQPV